MILNCAVGEFKKKNKQNTQKTRQLSYMEMIIGAIEMVP